MTTEDLMKLRPYLQLATQGQWRNQETRVYLPDGQGGFDIRNSPNALRNADAIAKLLTSGIELLDALEALGREVAELKDDLAFVERWAVHHGTKPHMTAKEALSCIQHYPAIRAITKSYVDGKVPETCDPFAERDQARAELAAIRANEVKWEGAEGWEPLAWQLCAEENGEDACSELIWEGGPIPEPWGDRWLKYEDEAKRLIKLVREYASPADKDAGLVADGCLWTQDSHFEMGDTYDSGCGEKWAFIDGGPAENNVRFCQGCGKPVKLTYQPKIGGV